MDEKERLLDEIRSSAGIHDLSARITEKMNRENNTLWKRIIGGVGSLTLLAVRALAKHLSDKKKDDE